MFSTLPERDLHLHSGLGRAEESCSGCTAQGEAQALCCPEGTTCEEDPQTGGVQCVNPTAAAQSQTAQQGEGLEFGEQRAKSGDIDIETDISIEGDNNNLCSAVLQFANIGNCLNQQGALQQGGVLGDL